MIVKLYDMCVAARRYTVNGEEKTSWLNIGSILHGENQPFMMLKAHFNPAGISRKENAESILVSLFAPKDSSGDDVFCWTRNVGSKLYDVCVGTRKYTSNGQEKTAYENVGAVIMSENRPYMMLKAHFNPAAITRKEGSESISLSLFRPKQQEEASYSSESYDETYAPMDFEAIEPF